MPIRRSWRDALLHSAFDDVFQVDDAEQALPVGTRPSGVPPLREMRSLDLLEIGRDFAAALDDELADRVGGALAKLAAFEVDAAHSRVGREGNERRFVFRNVPAAKAVFLLGEDHDRAALRRLVGQAGQLRGIGQFLVR